MTVGFIAVFGVFGLVVSPVASQVQQYLPWFTVAFGVAGGGGRGVAGRRSRAADAGARADLAAGR